VDVGLLHRDHDPPFGPPPGDDVDLVGRVPEGEVAGGQQARRPVDVQADQVADEIDEQQPDVRVPEEVAGAGHHAVAAVLGPGEGAVVQDESEPGRAGPERGVALPVGVGRGDEHHLHASDELPHLVVEAVVHLLGVEAVGAVVRTARLLELVLAGGARSVQRGGHLARLRSQRPR
jgi:hypothetical protein